MRKPQRKESVVFEGRVYTRYPDGKSPSGRKYFYNQSTGRALHQAVWESVHGPIPGGHHIHHRDGDTSNNVIENLELLTPAEHNRRHGNKSPARLAHFERIRKLASAWHASPEGLAWHSEHGKRTWADREGEPRTCENCGREYQCVTKRDTDKFCSRSCEQRWHYRNKTYFTSETCAVCGGEFLRPPSKKQRACSPACGFKLRKRDRDTGRLI
jgi:hypothetical protein